MTYNLSFDLEFKGKQYRFKAVSSDFLFKHKDFLQMATQVQDTDPENMIASGLESVVKTLEIISELYIGKEDAKIKEWRISEQVAFIQEFTPFLLAKLMGPLFKAEIDLEKGEKKKLSI